MHRSKYSNFLTIILILAIVIILVIVGIIVANIYKKYNMDKAQQQVFSEFVDNSVSNTENIVENTNTEINLVDTNTENSTLNLSTSNTNTTNTKRNVVYYPDTSFVVAGIIEIKAINLKYSILEKETAKSLEKSVAIRYPSNPALNTVGNVVIVGHNYRDGRFFSNLKKLVVGNEIKITDNSKKTVTYEIYEIFETTPEDTNYMTRNTDGKVEISLSTCTDNGKARLILLARQK